MNVQATGGLSQRLAMMRAEGLVAKHRAAQTIHCRIADTKAERGLEVLHEVCGPRL